MGERGLWMWDEGEAQRRGMENVSYFYESDPPFWSGNSKIRWRERLLQAALVCFPDEIPDVAKVKYILWKAEQSR